jgi:aspartyl-tRNA(Asn)/glutamyl-tRNA(Gln) amidotransferase subunit C
MISENDLEKLAVLARLELDPSMKSALTGVINSILEYVKRLDQVDVTGITAMSHTNEAINVLREDEVCPVGSPTTPHPLGDPTLVKQGMLCTEDLLRNAPDSSGTFIRVPLIVE